MKRKSPRPSYSELRARIVMLEHVISALISRLGGEVAISAAEIDRHHGCRMEMHADLAGVYLKLHRLIAELN